VRRWWLTCLTGSLSTHITRLRRRPDVPDVVRHGLLIMAARPLFEWLDDPAADRGIRFGGRGEDWSFWAYDRLAQRARRLAWGLVEAGVRENDVVAIIQRSGPDFVATLFGTMLAGAIPSPVASPMTFQHPVTYRQHVRGLLTAARPAAVVTEADFASHVGELAVYAGVQTTLTPDALLAGVEEGMGSPRRATAEFALLQFTSGSSGRARGVRIPFAALEANVAAIRRWLQATERDAWASWLPLHHDMGLIGCLVTPVMGCNELWLMQPEQFVRHPLRYLRCFGVSGATITATPNFGLEYILRRVRQDALEGLDFSQWRAVVIGAERINPDTLDRFYDLLSPFGLRRRFLLPAYGLAEATLAVTGLPLQEKWTGIPVEPASLSLRHKVTICDSGSGGQRVVGCGRPLDGVAVTVVDEDGCSLPDGRVGEIIVRGISVAAGYAATDSASATRFDGTLRSGDAGFLVDGQLFVLGRLGDSMKIRGRAVFAEDLEAALTAAGVPSHRVAAALGLRGATPTVVAVFERPDEAWLAEARALLRCRTEGAAVVLVDAPKATIARTPSGKPKRRWLWRAFLEGDLPGRVVLTTP
jgi:acyl-CoA synthetase (AMP-forming)/AMP-acid ligase II